MLWFFGLAYAISWAWWIPIALEGQVVVRGEGWPTQLPGLLGPALAAMIVVARTEGRAGVIGFAGAWVRRPGSRVAWFMVCAPLATVVVVALLGAVTGVGTPLDALGRASGVAIGIVPVSLALIVGGYGEEAGWRGFAQPSLSRRYGPLRATSVVWLAWSIWHVPLFFTLASFEDFGPLMALGWGIGLLAGAIVLASVAGWARGSVLAAALWHAGYNLGAGTSFGDGLAAPVLTAGVVFWAVSVVQRERAGLPAFAPAGPRQT